MIPLTKQQARALAFIASRKVFPSLLDIAGHVGWKNASSARECLETLVCKGMVGREHKVGLTGYRWWVTEAGHERVKDLT